MVLLSDIKIGTSRNVSVRPVLMCQLKSEVLRT